MYEHIIFDFDGVISNSFGEACLQFNKLRRTYFPTLPKINTQEDMAYAFSGPLKTSLRRFGLTDTESKNFYDLHSASMKKQAYKVLPFDKVVESITLNLQGRCSVVTSSYSEAVQAILAKSSNYRDDIFLTVYGREQNLPKSTKISKIIEENKLNSTNVIYIGDMVSDILYCQDVPIDIGVVGYGYHPSSYLKVFNPTFCWENINELCTFLSKNK